jgi:hypothetical protein
MWNDEEYYSDFILPYWWVQVVIESGKQK